MATSEQQFALFLTQLFVLLVSARVLGEAARTARQPEVVGELLAGIVLGPSLLGHLAPGGFSALFPAAPAQRAMLETIARPSKTSSPAPQVVQLSASHT